MKPTFNHIIILAALVTAASCKKDNFDPPGSTLKGRITYNGEPIMVEQNQVRFQLWEPGWGLNGALDVAIGQDGSYSAVLFDGNYKLVIPKNEGPFMAKSSGNSKDTLMISLKGNTDFDIEVMPYYMIRNTQFSQAGGKVSSTVSIEKIITGVDAKDITAVSLYINKTAYVGANGNMHIQRKDSTVSGTTDFNSLQLTVNIPAITPAQNYVFARIGVKIAGVEDRLYSPVQKITF
jgi:hypothetical protein